MELRFVERSIKAPELGKNFGRIVKILQYRQMEKATEEWTLGPWKDVPFVAPDDE